MNSLPAFLTMAVCSLLLTGCLSPSASPEVQYYRLQPADPAPESIGSFDEPLVVGPVELSPYLQRPQLARHDAPNRVAYAEYHRWAEPLDWNLSVVVAGELSSLLETDRIRAYSPRSPGDPARQALALRLHTFEIGADGAAAMRAAVFFPDGAVWDFSGREPVSGEGVEADVAALNRLVLRFSRELAKRLTLP